jgi:preprotein translocase subunit SecY
MIESLRNIFVIPDLRKRIIFTFLMLAVFRIGAHIPTPGINGSVVEEFFQRAGGSWLGFMDIFSGGALRKLTVFSLGIMPYISASIVLQLLTVVWPYLERLSKEGELGRKKITQYTRYGTVLLASIQAAAISTFLEKLKGPTSGLSIVTNPGWPFRLMTVLTLTAGTIFIMWLGEQISARGIGNGISLIIFAGIIVRFPSAVIETVSDLRSGTMSIIKFLILVIVMVAVIAFIILVERAQRRIPISYAKRIMGRRMYGGQSTHLPLRLNTGGVIPIIFAAAIIMLPQMAVNFFRNITWLQKIANAFGYGQPLYNLLYIAAIIFFCYFYTAIIFNPIDVAENMRKYGGFIPGIRPGKRTAEYIDHILTRITFVGSIYLAAVAILPEFLSNGLKVQSLPYIGGWLDLNLPMWFTEGLGVKFYFGGTSLLIVVGVAMDTIQQIESQLIMRHYDGFLKKGRIRGRR